VRGQGGVFVHDKKTNTRVAEMMLISTMIFGSLFMIQCRTIETNGQEKYSSRDSISTIPDSTQTIIESKTIGRLNTNRITQLQTWDFKADGAIISAALSSDDKYIAINSANGTTRILDFQNGTILYEDVEPNHGVALVVLFLKVTEEYVVGYQDGILERRSFDGTTIWESKLIPGFYNIAHAFDRNILCVSSYIRFKNAEEGLIQFIDLNNGELLHTIQGTGADFIPGKDGFLLGTAQGHVELWEITTYTMKAKLDMSNWGRTFVIVSPDGLMAMMIAENNRSSGDVRLMRIEDASYITALWATKQIITAVYSPDSQLIATSTAEDNAIQLWGATDGYMLSRLSGHSKPVSSIVFNSTGELIASGSLDGTIRIWGIQ
jgi:WD40 repeat protein